MIKKIMLGILSVLLMSSVSFALTFPVDIQNCKIIGKTIGITGWWSQWRENGQYYHHAIDIPVPAGTKVKAPESGEVEVGYEYPKYDYRAKCWRSGFGNYVRIKIYEKRMTVLGEVKVLKYSYTVAHLLKPARIDDGDIVGEGQVIGYSGSTGVVDDRGRVIIAPHVHFQKEDASGAKINMVYEFGQIVKAYFGSNDKYAFTTIESNVDGN